jgi:polyhydroxybutyrate depolymerase
MVGGIERTYRLYVPSKLPDAPVALFIALHGGTGWGDQFAQTDHIESLAESNGFVVVHPDGVKVQGGPGGAWNAGACCGAPARDGVDDVAFVAALVDAMEARFTIDPTRVFAIGHSNGAMMSFRLACDLSDRITGIGMWAGSLETDSCTPTHPVSIIQGHGDADMNIPLAGGDGSEGIADVDFTPPHDGFVRIADAAGCPAGSTSTTGDITTEERSPCAEGAAAEFVTIHTATHTWPESAALRTPASGPAYQGWDATAQIVAFLLAHPRAG